MKLNGFLGLLVAGLFAQTASAVPTIIDFATGTAGAGGTISYIGGANPLSATAIPIGQVSGIATPSNNGTTATVTGGTMQFTTGNFVSFSGGVYTFGAGGFLTITGSGPGCLTVGGCGSGVPNAPTGSPLLTANVVSATYNPITGSTRLAILTGSDTKDPALLAFFGLAANTQFNFGGTVFSSLTSGGSGGAFTASGTGSVDIQNNVVPEPAAVLLLGTIMVGITGMIRRRTSKA